VNKAVAGLARLEDGQIDLTSEVYVHPINDQYHI